MANSDYTKSPDEILLDLINTDNPGHNITLEQITLAPPSVVVTGTETDPSYLNRKTKVRVASVAGSGYTDYVDVTYNRIHFRDIITPTEDNTVQFPKTTEQFTIGTNVNLSDLVPQINSQYNINLQPGDYWNVPLPTFEGMPPYPESYVRLEAKADSKVYIGGVQIKINPNDYDLANLPVTTLSGLIYPTWQVRFTNFVSNTMDKGAGFTFW